jgi:hypothetical protein
MTYLFYIIVTMLSILFMGLYSNIKKGDYKYKNSLAPTLITLSFLCLFLPLVLRDVSVGTDYSRYETTFNYISTHNSIDENVLSWLGAPFILMIKLAVSIFATNYVFFYGAVGFVGILFLYLSILRRSKIPWLSLASFISFCLYFQMFNQIRQMVAICIILYSLRYIEARNIYKFLLIIGLACAFHQTAILFLPMYFLCRLKVNALTILTYALLGAAIYTFFPIIMSVVSLTSYGQVYTSSNLDFAFGWSTVLNLLVRLVMFILSLLFLKRLTRYDKRDIYLYNLVAWSTLMQVLTVSSALFGRLTTMFFVFYIFLIPEIIASFSRRMERRLSLLMVLSLLFVYQFAYYNSPNGALSGGYATYRTINLNN